MSQLQTKQPTYTWVAATWDEYIQIIEKPEYQKAYSISGVTRTGNVYVKGSFPACSPDESRTSLCLAISPTSASKIKCFEADCFKVLPSHNKENSTI